MAGFLRHCAPRRSLHETLPEHGSAGAAEYGGSIVFSVSLPFGARNARLVVLCDDDGSVSEYPLCDGRLDVAASELCRGKCDGLFFYKFVFETDSGMFQTVRARDGISDTVAHYSDGFENAYQLTVYRKRARYPDWLAGGTMYQIFPDRFFRAGNEPCRDNAVMNDDWYEGIPPYVRKAGERLENNVFFGGDLYGIEQKLDYIASLGTTCIYLNPIFEAYTNHKYDTGNYDAVDAMFGGEEAFELLLRSAEKRGIRIILDGVFNHTGDDSVYFNKKGRYGDGGAYRDENSPYWEWYNFYHYPDKYESWWNIDILPRVKCDTPSYEEYIFGRVIKRRLRQGVSGFRLDVADELTDGFLRELKTAATEESPDCVVIGEVWEDASNKVSYGARRKYFRGDELDSVMNYPVRDAIISYLRDGDHMTFLKTVSDIYDNYPPEVANLLMNVIGTHDTERIITVLAGESSDGKTPDELARLKMTAKQYETGEALVKAAYLILCVLPGVPCIYYGDEIGMEGYRDPFNRRPYPWGLENKVLLGFYKRLGEIRKSEKSLFLGDFRVVFVDSDILCIERTADERYLCAVVNRSDDEYIFSSEESSRELICGKENKTHIIAPRSCVLVTGSDGGSEYGVYKKI